MLAFRHFPHHHWRKIWSTNLLERVNEEIKRRTRVVGIFPNDPAITRMVGAVLLEQDEHWQLEVRRMFSAEIMAAIPALDALPTAVAAVPGVNYVGGRAYLIVAVHAWPPRPACRRRAASSGARSVRHLQGSTDVSDGLALSNQLLSDFELADDMQEGVASSFHGGVPGPVWPDEDSHSAWTDLRGPRHLDSASVALFRSPYGGIAVYEPTVVPASELPTETFAIINTASSAGLTMQCTRIFYIKAAQLTLCPMRLLR